MSAPRRTGADINILALLDGQTGRPSQKRLRPATLYYGAAGLLALALVGTLAWLAYDTGNAMPAPRVAVAAASTALPLPVSAPVPLTAAAPPPALPSAPPPPPYQPVLRVPVPPKPAPHPAPPRRPAPVPKAKPSTPPVDTDVAWIAAILRHEANAREAQATSCGERPCAPPGR